ncbi:3-hydroxyacyl-CoA dehydrogenase family protein [Amycolatopsis sp. cmx-4-68]|uniref:3-hydroxyacyl-CoA dehydrogenase family protein n=1 Tax=Amycolatopsis sp. cmx-4-68 TaxID=2790938 RepID=UPI00397D354C
MTEEQPTTVGVLGLGSTGGAWADLLTAAGVPVVAVDGDPAVVARRRWPGATVTTRLDALASAGVVIEAVPEDLELKGAVLRSAAAVCGPETAFASTTASLSLTALAVASGRPTWLAGLRTLLPPPAGGVELAGTSMTDPATLAAVRAVLDLLPVRLAELGPAGGATRRMLLAFLNRAAVLGETGESGRDDIDTAMRLGCGLPHGPFELLDRIGIDAAVAELDVLHRETGRAAFEPATLLRTMTETGALGRKTGRGFYRYDTGYAAPEPAVVPGGTPRPVRRVGVVGSGIMARGIAQVTTSHGLPTVLVARSTEKAEAARAAIDASLERAVRRGQVGAEQRKAALAALVVTTDVAGLADCDIAIEAVSEDEQAKAAVFAGLDRVCRPGAVLATTTSSLSVADCAKATRRPADVVGLHFFNPAPAMRLVEVGRTGFVADDVVATAHAFATALGKTPVGCPDRSGFLVNHLLFPYLNDAAALVENGAATIEEVDTAVAQGLGFPMGPFALLDAIGLDVSEAIQLRLHEANDDPDVKPTAMLSQLVALGRLGRKTEAGFHSYSVWRVTA